ncbi:apolipoprotein D-like [Galleria mellonella]|uniref:Apolipoprotein D-like n=1 Tax=Galleria mellonella TaxID=7137 RepID=A0A6J1X3I5_GALME|nr:apolipoprotein D-like [Galleria mellonella]
MLKTIYLIVTVILRFELSNTQILHFGKCAEVETMRYFDLERFLGIWYEIERFPTWYEENGHCAHKRIQACGRTVVIEHYFIRNGIQYVLQMNSTYSPGDEAVFEIEESNIDPVGIPFSVITTDYDNYAIVYGCKYNEHIHIKYISAWILSRTSTLSPELREQARSELTSIPFANAAYLQTVEQGERYCTYHWTAYVQTQDKDIENV